MYTPTAWNWLWPCSWSTFPQLESGYNSILSTPWLWPDIETEWSVYPLSHSLKLVMACVFTLRHPKSGFGLFVHPTTAWIWLWPVGPFSRSLKLLMVGLSTFPLFNTGVLDHVECSLGPLPKYPLFLCLPSRFPRWMAQMIARTHYSKCPWLNPGTPAMSHSHAPIV